MRINKTEKNLQEIWQQLDDASGLLENALLTLNSMSKLPDNVISGMESIDISAITGLKNDVEELIDEIKSNK